MKSMGQYNFEVIKRHKFETALIFIAIALTFVLVTITGNTTGKQDLGNYFWMPSSIMQSVAAIYALFVAVLVLSIQNNQKIISLIGDLLKPPFKMVSYIVATTIYFNGLLLFIFSFRKPTELQVSSLYSISLISLLVSLIAIVYFSIRMISTVAGLKTHEETLYNLSQGKDIEACYSALDLDGDYSLLTSKWFLKSVDKQNKEIEYIVRLLEHGSPEMKIQIARFISYIGDTRAGEQLIKNLDDNNESVRSNSASALGIFGYTKAVEPLIIRLDDPSLFVRRNSAQALGRIGDVRAVNPLIKRLDDPHEDVIVSSELALGKIGDLRAIEPLLRKLNDNRDRVREFAAEALGLIGDPRVIGPLTERLEDKNPGVRNRSKTALEIIQKHKAG